MNSQIDSVNIFAVNVFLPMRKLVQFTRANVTNFAGLPTSKLMTAGQWTES